MTRIRHSVQSPEGLDNLKILGEAAQIMRNLPAEDPHSWEYQAGIHGTENAALKLRQFIDNCPHYFQAGTDTTKFFLIWHRLYLHHFEEAIRAVSGNDSFMLPYWDATDPNQRTIPIPFLSESDGGFKGLFDATRQNNVNDGVTKLGAFDPDIAARLERAGADIREQGAADFLVFNQAIDGNPHGTVHNAIGGNMGDFATAGLDPIFWVHHANIDRLFAEYGKDPVNSEQIGKLNPGMTIGFFDRDKNPITYTYTEAAEIIYELDYAYDTGATASAPAQAKEMAAADSSQGLIKGVNKSLAALTHGDILTGWDALSTSRNRKTSTILAITIEAQHDLSGYVDIFYADAPPGSRNRIPKQNVSFDSLTRLNKGGLMDRYYIGSLGFVPHSTDGLEDTNHHHHHHHHADTLPEPGEATKTSSSEEIIYFDISRELNLQRNLRGIPDLIHFNIDPTQAEAEKLGQIMVKSIALVQL